MTDIKQGSYTVVTDEHRNAFSKARIDMMSASALVFYTSLIMTMDQYWDDQVEDYETDGLSYSINPDWFMSLNKPQRVYTLGKIAYHVAMLHAIRMTDHEKPIWDRAATNVANLELKARKLKAPPGEEAQERFVGKSVEEVYKILKDEQRKDEDPNANDPNHLQTPGTGQGSDSSKANNDGSHANTDKTAGMSPSDIMNQASEMVQQAITNAQAAGEPGSIPGSLQFMLDKLNAPMLPWHVILRRWMNRFDKTDYSFRKPNRRFMPEFILPSLYGEAMITLAVAVDISGSVSDADFQEIIGHTSRILDSVKPDKIILIQFDTRIQEINIIRRTSDLYKVDFHGRGGTDISCILDWADKHKPEGLIFFSDGGFYHPRQECKHDTLWLTHDNEHFTAPYGKVIHYKMSHGQGW